MDRFDSVWDTEDAVAPQYKAMDKDKLQICDDDRQNIIIGYPR